MPVAKLPADSNVTRGQSGHHHHAGLAASTKLFSYSHLQRRPLAIYVAAAAAAVFAIVAVILLRAVAHRNKQRTSNLNNSGRFHDSSEKDSGAFPKVRRASCPKDSTNRDSHREALPVWSATAAAKGTSECVSVGGRGSNCERNTTGESAQARACLWAAGLLGLDRESRGDWGPFQGLSERRAAGFGRWGVSTAGVVEVSSAMDGKYKHRRDHNSGSSGTGSSGSASRAVSTADGRWEKLRHTSSSPSTAALSSAASSHSSDRRKAKAQASDDSARWQAGGSGFDGIQKGKGKSSSSSHGKSTRNTSQSTGEVEWDTQELGYTGDGMIIAPTMTADPDSGYHPPPPPPPPLVGPTATNAHAFDGRGSIFATSIPPALDMRFMSQQPKSYRQPQDQQAQLDSSSAAKIRTYGYAKSFSSEVPPSSIPPNSADTITTAETFSPFSPPDSSYLPAPAEYEFAYDTWDYAWGKLGEEEQGEYVDGGLDGHDEIGLHGELMGVDDVGHSWTRHTRVYGGGVCLACAASGGEGGFYGERVPMEQRVRR